MEHQQATPPLEIRVFGSFEVRLNGRPLPPLRTRKGSWLLVLLALKQERPVDRAWLAGTLWPEVPETHAFTSLRKSLNDLRCALGEVAPRLYAPTPRTLALDLSDAYCDLTIFDASIALGDDESLERAIAVYGGPLLETCSEDWLLIEREARQHAYLNALETLAVRSLDRDEPGPAIERLRLCIGVDPLRESAQRRLMQAFAWSGQYAAVTQTYRDLRLYLRRELHCEPAPQTTQLYEQLRQEARQSRPIPVLGPHTSRPESLPLTVPRPVTELIGRESEIAELEAYLEQASLVTLTGAGGVGKTRLAIAMAQRQQGAGTDRVCFVDLAGISDANLVTQTVASALGIREQASRALSDILVETLAGQFLLLILDNCEHLIRECVNLTSVLLHHCPQLRVLTTSRQALGIMGEVVWRVPSLAQPDMEPAAVEKDAVSYLMEFDSVQLFVSRARSSHPAFRMTARNAWAVARICRRLDGIPLAIEMAATRVRVLTPEQIAERLDDRFHLLTAGSQDALPRQRTLRAALDWSYDLLSEEERTVLRRVAVFSGGWTLEAMEAVCCGQPQRLTPNAQHASDVLDLLTSLVDKSLVIFEQTANGEGRYRLLETVRHYGLDRLQEAGEQEEWGRRHFEYSLTLAEEAATGLHDTGHVEWLDRLEVEHDNLRAALQFGVRRPERKATEGDPRSEFVAMSRLALALAKFWDMRCYWTEGRTYLDHVLAAQTGADPAMRANLLIAAGNLAHRQGEFEAAQAMYDESLALSRSLNNPHQIACALRHLGALACNQSDYAAARVCYEESLAIAREQADPRGIAADLTNLATVVQPTGDFTTAMALLQESLAVFRALDDQASVAVILNNLGNAAYWAEDYAQAQRFFEESLAIRREFGNKRGIALTLGHLGSVALDQGDCSTARSLFEESLAYQCEIGQMHQSAYMLHNLGLVAFCQADYAEAHRLLRESTTILRVQQDRLALASALEAFAGLAAAQGASARAARLWGAAATLREAIGAPQSPRQRKESEAQIAAAHAALGEEEFVAANAEGRMMPLDRALDFALQPTLISEHIASQTERISGRGASHAPDMEHRSY